MSDLPSTPQSDKLADRADEYNAVHEFLEYLGTKGIVLAQYGEQSEHFPTPVPTRHDDIVLEFLGVDARALDKERNKLLAFLQEGRR